MTFDEEVRREHFNAWYAVQAMPDLLARIDPQQAAHNAFEEGVRFAAQPQAAPQPEAPAELRSLDTPTRVRFYEHDFYVLSNFSAFNLQWNGHTYPTSEHAYQAAKFDPVGIGADVARARSAHDAFKIAERHKAFRRPDWDDVKIDVMRHILRAKVDQHEYVRRKLLATGDRELVEDSWRDDYWGWGQNRDGQNMLGKLWMEVRAELRSDSSPGGRQP